MGFCRRCIKTNLGKLEIERVEDDDFWRCYMCNPEPLKVSTRNFECITISIKELVFYMSNYRL